MIVPHLLILLGLGLWWTDPVQAQPELRTLTNESLDECRLGRMAQERASRLTHFEKGRHLGEQAVSIDDKSPNAHFALFCNLGELMRLDGEMSLGSVLGFRRMMKELDRTLELAPDHLDALSARGTFLVRLPAMLGGNPDTGEQLLRRVIASEPTAVNARLSLAKSYCSRGRHNEAVVLASEALALAEAQHLDDFIPEAKRVMTQLHAATHTGR